MFVIRISLYKYGFSENCLYSYYDCTRPTIQERPNSALSEPVTWVTHRATEPSSQQSEISEQSRNENFYWVCWRWVRLGTTVDCTVAAPALAEPGTAAVRQLCVAGPAPRPAPRLLAQVQPRPQLLRLEEGVTLGVLAAKQYSIFVTESRLQYRQLYLR